MMTTDLRMLDARANKTARGHMGEFAWPTVMLGGSIIMAYTATLSAAMSGVLPLIVAYIITSLLVYAVYTILHEAVHGSINGSHKSRGWVNEAFGYIAGQILGLPYQLHRREHLTHHRNTNKNGDDPDMVFGNGSYLGVIFGAFKVIPANYNYYFEHFWKGASRKEKIIVILEMIGIVSWRLAIVLAGYWWVGLVLFVFAAFTGILITATMFAWIVHHPHEETDRYRNTSTIILPGWLNLPVTWLWLFQNYHSIHHLFPRIPFYHYKSVFGEIEDVMQAHAAPIIRVGRSAPKVASA